MNKSRILIPAVHYTISKDISLEKKQEEQILHLARKGYQSGTICFTAEDSGETIIGKWWINNN